MKRRISFLLILLLLLPVLPARAFAEDALTWKLQGSVLIIDGKGSMHDFEADVAPWRSYEKQVQELEVSYGVTHIGSQAFQYMSRLKTVELPESVTSIGEAAFYKCGDLGFVRLPGGLKELETSVFDHCTSLKKVSLPEGMEEIGSAAFNCCSALEEIVIPASVLEIEDSAFNACRSLKTVYYTGSRQQWERIEVEGYNKYLLNAKIVFNANPADHISSEDEVWADHSRELYWTLSADKTLTISGYGRMPDYSSDVPPWEKERANIKAIVIESGITHVGSQSFQYCKNVRSVSLPGTVQSIGDAAFYKCESLREITLPAGLQELGEQAFDHCEKLRSISVPGGVSEIPEAAFNCCAALETAELPSGVSAIGNSAFNGCKKLKDVWFAGSAADWAEVEIGAYNTPLSRASLHTEGTGSADAGGVIGGRFG